MSWERGQAEGSLSSLHRGMLGPRHVSQSGRHPAIMILMRKLRIKKSERGCQNATTLNADKFLFCEPYAIRGWP
jgi:hypothetical protein